MEPERFDLLAKLVGVGVPAAGRRRLLIGGLAAAAAVLLRAPGAEGAKRPLERVRNAAEGRRSRRRRVRDRRATGEAKCGNNERRCPDGKCIREGGCCDDEYRCQNGSCAGGATQRFECCPEDGLCRPGFCRTPRPCCRTVDDCPFQQRCEAGTCCKVTFHDCASNAQCCSRRCINGECRA